MKKKFAILALSALLLISPLFFVIAPDEQEVVSSKIQPEYSSSTPESVPISGNEPPEISEPIVLVEKENKEQTDVTNRDCDYTAMKSYAGSLLAQSEWNGILSKYEVREYEELGEIDIDIFVNGEKVRLCVLKLNLWSEEYTFAKLDTLKFSYYDAYAVVLELLNPTRDYSSAGFSFAPHDEMEIFFASADGPGSSSHGTYQYNEDNDTVRLFRVNSGIKRSKSAYGAEQEEDICPCKGGLGIWITDEIPVSELEN